MKWFWTKVFLVESVFGLIFCNLDESVPYRLRGVDFIERIEDPAVLSQHRGMRRANGKMMRGSRQLCDRRGRWRDPADDETAVEWWSWPAGKTPKMKGRRRQVKRVHGV